MLQTTKKGAVIALAALPGSLLFGCGGGGTTDKTNKGNGGVEAAVAGASWDQVEVVFTPKGDACTSQWPTVVEGYPNNEYEREFSYCAKCERFQFCVHSAPGYVVAHNGQIHLASGPIGGFPHCTSDEEFIDKKCLETCDGLFCEECDVNDDDSCWTCYTDPDFRCAPVGAACLVPFCDLCNADGSCSTCSTGYEKGLAFGPEGVGTKYQFCLPTDPGCPDDHDQSVWDDVAYLEHNLCQASGRV